MTKRKLEVTKASGIDDEYSHEKLRKSLAKSGAGEPLINEIIHGIDTKLYPGISTDKIYTEAFNMLKQHSRGYANRYNLKRAIMSMGPSGFPFEQYMGSIFEWIGYQVKLKQILTGTCVTHEIDVLAENKLHVLMIECKFHNSPGVVSDVKVPLYIHSRYRDVLGMWNRDAPLKTLEGAVVTNTKFSTDAIKYGVCAGLQMLGWNYPEQKSLSSLVDASRLYPLTCLTTLTNNEKERLLLTGVVLCKDLKENQSLLRNIGVSEERISGIFTEINEIVTGMD